MSQFLNVSTVGAVADYYPNLGAVARLSPTERLPLMHNVHRAKIVWTVLFNGLLGEVCLCVCVSYGEGGRSTHCSRGQLTGSTRGYGAGASESREGGTGPAFW